MWMFVPLVLIAVAYAGYWYLTKDADTFKKRNILGPEPKFLFGNSKDLTQTKKFIGTILEDLYNQYPNEKLVGFFRMTVPHILLRDLDLVKNILIKDFDLFMDRGVELDKKGLGNNLFSAGPDMWRVLRTKFTPIFTSGKLKNMFHLLHERADKFMENFKVACKEQPEQDIQLAARMFTMSSIAACAFGLDIDLYDPKVDVLHRLDKLLLSAKPEVEFLLMFPRLLKLLNSVVFPHEVTKFFYDLVKTVFTQRNGMPTNRKDFMDLILEMRQQKIIKGNKLVNDSEITLELNEHIIAAQAFVFYVAGYETSSTTLSFLFYELTQNPDVQEKLLAEIDEVLEKSGGEITYDVLMDMPYLAKVFDETLRKYPIVDPLQRCALEDYPIPGTQQFIKKGEMIFVPVLGIHYDEKYYPNPQVFDPERFSPENAGNRHPCAYLPFGAGPRNCIGMRFAKVQSRMFLVKLLSKYRVEASDNTPKVMRPDPNRVLMGPLYKVNVKIIERK